MARILLALVAGERRQSRIHLRDSVLCPLLNVEITVFIEGVQFTVEPQPLQFKDTLPDGFWFFVVFLARKIGDEMTQGDSHVPVLGAVRGQSLEELRLGDDDLLVAGVAGSHVD